MCAAESAGIVYSFSSQTHTHKGREDRKTGAWSEPWHQWLKMGIKISVDCLWRTARRLIKRHNCTLLALRFKMWLTLNIKHIIHYTKSHLREGVRRGQQHVLRFQVTVSDMFKVQIPQSLEDLHTHTHTEAWQQVIVQYFLALFMQRVMPKKRYCGSQAEGWT